jgi:hypothetical protein
MEVMTDARTMEEALEMHKISTVAKTSSAFFVLSTYVAPQGHHYIE